MIKAIWNFIFPSKRNDYKPRLLYGNTLFVLVILILVLKIGLITISIRFPQNVFFADITRSALETLVNQTRESLGLEPLENNAKLNQAARLKAENMVKDQYFSHTSPTGISPWYWFKQAGYTYKYAGENLAVGFFESGEVFNAWLNSAGHRANIVNPDYTEFGTAILEGFGQNNAIVVVQEFGSQKSPVKTPVNTNNSANQPLVPAVNTELQVKPAPENNGSLPENSPVAESNQQVLSDTITPQISGITTGRDSFFLRVLNFVLYDYYALLQNIIYGIFIFVAGALVISALPNPRKDFILRASIIIIILGTAVYLDRRIILSLIPHEIII